MKEGPVRKPAPTPAASRSPPRTATAARPHPPWLARRCGRPEPRTPFAGLPGGIAGILQPRLSVGGVSDPLEREADRIADAVLAGDGADFGQAPLTLQRWSGTAAPAAAEAPASVHRALAEPGRALDPAVRSEIEPRFGRDFSQVRIHDGAAAGASASDVGALAYTVSNHIVFGPGRYAPQTRAGRHLLAHELAHVAQQAGSSGAVVRRQAKKEAPPIDPARIKAMTDLCREASAMKASGLIAAAEGALIAAAVAEAVSAVVSALAIAGAGTGAVMMGEGGLAASAGLLADDVTGIGVADDVAIPFTLIAAGIGFGVGWIIEESGVIPDAWAKAVTAVETAVAVITGVVEAAKARTAKPQTGTIGSAGTSTAPTSTAIPVSVAVDRVADKTKQEGLNRMRFQVQWGKGKGEFSDVAIAPPQPGVTTAQATAALASAVVKVQPKAARKAAEPAAAEQLTWILRQPPWGVQQLLKRTKKFDYENYTDARVDVENLRGHNLRL